jgi:hypothetical protein
LDCKIIGWLLKFKIFFNFSDFKEEYLGNLKIDKNKFNRPIKKIKNNQNGSNIKLNKFYENNQFFFFQKKVKIINQ